MDLIHMGIRKRQDLLSKLGGRGPWKRMDGNGRGRKINKENIQFNKINNKNNRLFKKQEADKDSEDKTNGNLTQSNLQIKCNAL